MDDDYDLQVQKKLDSAMPWVGLYITLASAVCAVAMVADLFNGIRHKKLWFPCKHFSMNAASLTVIAAALKLPMDLNTGMQHSGDWLARIVGLYFMTTMMSNFLPSLGSKKNNGILTDVVALGILVITILVNIWIQTVKLDGFNSRQQNNAVIAVTFFMLLLLVTTTSSAITIPINKRILESKYQEILMAEQGARDGRDGLSAYKQAVNRMMKYWVVAQTGNLQFVAARSVFSITSGMICLLSDITLVAIYVKWFQANSSNSSSLWETKTAYGLYTKRICVVQSIGVAVGTIAPIFRWLSSVGFKFTETTFSKRSLRKEFKIEARWSQNLVYCRANIAGLRIQGSGCKKYFYDAKWFVLTLCIGFQVFNVVLGKVLLLGSTFVASPFLLCLNWISKKSGTDQRLESSTDHQSNFSRYVLLLEGEAELPTRTLKNILHQAEKLIEKGKAEQPQNLIRFLSAYKSFDGLQVPCLESQTPFDCWTLRLVTLTSVAVSLPNVTDHKIKQLISSMNEGLFLTKLIDKKLDTNARLANIRKAANTGWAAIAQHREWQGIDLTNSSFKYKKSKEVLQVLSTTAERIVVEFNRDAKPYETTENPLIWPISIVLANSMHRTSRTILLSRQEEQADNILFEQLCATIARILAACLTNLATVITTMCHCNAIEKREKSLRKGLLLLGKMEKIFQLLGEYGWEHERSNEEL